jgi:hypothetical protein
MAFPIIPKKRSGATGNPSSLNLGELAVNTLTGELFLGADGGVTLLNGPVAAGTTVTEHTGDGTTVAFTFGGYNGTADGGYIVSVGGIDQPPSTYAVTSTAGGTLTFVEAPVTGELISIRAIVAGSGGGGGGTSGFARTRYIADGTQTAFSPIEGFSVAGTDRNKYLVQVAGNILDEDAADSTFTFSSDSAGTITFSSPPAEDTRIVLRAFGASGNLEIPKYGFWYYDLKGATVSLYGNTIKNSSNIPFSGSAAADFTDYIGGQNSLKVPVTLSATPWCVEFFINTLNSAVPPSGIAVPFIGYLGATEFSVYWISSGLAIDLAGTTIPLSVGQDTAWHHIALCVDGSNSFQAFFDGVSVATASFSLSGAGVFSLAAHYEEYISGYQFTGLISNFRVSNVLRYTSAFTPPTSSFTVDGDTVTLLTMNA